MYALYKYLPIADPVTPIMSTIQMFRSNFIWKKTITVHAGGPIRGIISTTREAKKTRI